MRKITFPIIFFTLICLDIYLTYQSKKEAHRNTKLLIEQNDDLYKCLNQLHRNYQRLDSLRQGY